MTVMEQQAVKKKPSNTTSHSILANKSPMYKAEEKEAYTLVSIHHFEQDILLLG